jgi:hypothetical protein
MRAGDYALAHQLADRTLAARDPATRDDPTQPYHRRWVWDGTPVDGRDVLVRCYHGLGDTIHYARHLPALAARARSVTLEVQPRLATLLSQFADIRIVPFDVAAPLPPRDCDVDITELPHALRATPTSAPYLRIHPALLPRDTIGLCTTAGDWDPARSIPPHLLGPALAERSAITLDPGPTDLPVLNPAGCPFDLDATAALVAACALVVTVDTMIAHLAGALGRPTWLLLKHDPDWRWPTGGSTTPLYPSVRLYHQPAPGDWASVAAAIARDLGEGR